MNKNMNKKDTVNPELEKYLKSKIMEFPKELLKGLIISVTFLALFLIASGIAELLSNTNIFSVAAYSIGLAALIMYIFKENISNWTLCKLYDLSCYLERRKVISMNKFWIITIAVAIAAFITFCVWYAEMALNSDTPLGYAIVAFGLFLMLYGCARDVIRKLEVLKNI